MITVYETIKGFPGRASDEDVAKEQRKMCKENDGKTPKGSAAAYLQSSKDKNFFQFAATDPYLTQPFKVDMTRPITKAHAGKVSSAVMQRNRGKVKKGSFAALYQACADRNEKHKELGVPIECRIETHGPNPMPYDLARKLQSEEARRNDGKIAKDSLASLALSAADKFLNQETTYEHEIEDIQESIEQIGFPTKKQAQMLESLTAKSHGGKIPVHSAAAVVQSLVDQEETSSEDTVTAQDTAITSRPDVNKKRSHVPRSLRP